MLQKSIEEIISIFFMYVYLGRGRDAGAELPPELLLEGAELGDELLLGALYLGCELSDLRGVGCTLTGAGLLVFVLFELSFVPLKLGFTRTGAGLALGFATLTGLVVLVGTLSVLLIGVLVLFGKRGGT
jgi:hypothetical protein